MIGLNLCPFARLRGQAEAEAKSVAALLKRCEAGAEAPDLDDATAALALSLAA